MSVTVETAKLPALLTALRLPTFARLWPEFCERADAEGWPAERLLAALCELELSERERSPMSLGVAHRGAIGPSPMGDGATLAHRIQRHLAAAKLAPGKTLDSFDVTAVPTVSQAKVRALAEGDSWLQAGHNLLAFGPPGVGKSHLAAGIGYELVQRGDPRPDGPDIRSRPAPTDRAPGSRPHPGDREARQARPRSGRRSNAWRAPLTPR